MAIASTENVRVGFFLGKASLITNLAKMQKFVCARLTKIAPSSLPPFQQIHDTLGPRDTITHSKAIMVECSRRDAGFLWSSLENYFSPTSKYPFIWFQVLFHLSNTAKLRYCWEHKNWMDGKYIMEIPFPSEFAYLDTQITIGEKVNTLWDFIFDYTPPNNPRTFVIERRRWCIKIWCYRDASP